MKFITEGELNVIKGLVHYLNANLTDAEVQAEILLIDPNGEKLATISIHDGGGYGLVL